MSSRKRSNQARARALRCSSKDISMQWSPEVLAILFKRTGTRFASKRLALRAVIGAAFVAAVAVNTHPRDPPRMRKALPDEARKVLQRRRSERLDLVEQLVVEHFLDLRHTTLQQPQIQHHPGRGIGRAAHRYLCTEGVAVDFLACRTQCRSRQRMRCLEPERFCQLPHFKNSKFYLIPIVLCVCRLSRHCGWRRQ